MVFEKILKCVKEKRSVFLSGPGGTGKSYTIRQVVNQLRDSKYNVAITASTGVAALNISGGKEMPSSTLHSWSGIELAREPAEYYIQKILAKPLKLKTWRTVNVLIIDEIGMLGKSVFDKLDEIARNVRKDSKDLPFGGITLIVSGDFLQLPPVNDDWIFNSEAWTTMNFKTFIFETPKRYDDIDFFEMLLRIRKARPYQKDIDALAERVKVYDEMMQRELEGKTPITEIKPTILYSKKIDVSAYNVEKLNELKGTPVNFVAKDTFQNYTMQALNYDYYMSMLDEISPKSVYLKVGAQVMLTYNIDIQLGLANGSRGVVIAIHPDDDEEGGGVTVKFISAGIHRIKPITVDYEDKNGIAKRTQIPFILAWSMTIHKSQGASLDSAILDIGPSVFSAGGAYVALSRVKNLKGVYLSNFSPSAIKVSKMALKYTEQISVDAENSEQIEPEYELDEDDVNSYLPQITDFRDSDVIRTIVKK